jgi:hypothetical protein
MREGKRAYDAWEAKSRGGRAKRNGEDGDNFNTPARVLEESSNTLPQKCQDSSTDSEPDSEPDSEEDDDSGSVVVVPNPIGPLEVCEAWNAMAARNGLEGVKTVSTERQKRLGARMAEHGAVALINGINLIPDHDFLLGGGPNGWKATFNWFVRPDSLTTILEGGYKPWKAKNAVPDRSTGPKNKDEADRLNNALLNIGSAQRWRLVDGKWVLRLRLVGED